MPIPTLTAVHSSNVKAIGHEGNKLYVQFNSGEIWAYSPVPRAIYDDMTVSKSIGSYFHKWVRSNAAYKGVMVQSPPEQPPPVVA